MSTHSTLPTHLQPLLVTVVRQKVATVALFDGGVFPDGADRLGSLLRGVGALEVRGVLEELGHEAAEALQLLLGGCGEGETCQERVLTAIERKTGGVCVVGRREKRRKHTILVVAHLDHARANAQEEDAVLLVLGAELGCDHVHGGLAGGVEGAGLDVVLVGKVAVGKAAGNDDDFLGIALEDHGHEEMVEVDVADDVGVEEDLQGLVDLLGLVGPVWLVSLFFILYFFFLLPFSFFFFSQSLFPHTQG